MRIDGIASEAQRMVREAAAPIPPGETIKGQLRRACRALGYSDGDWRVRAAWYGEAGSWSAVAFEDLRERYERWRGRNHKRAVAEAGRLVAVLERLHGADDAVLDRAAIAEVLDALRQFGGSRP